MRLSLRTRAARGLNPQFTLVLTVGLLAAVLAGIVSAAISPLAGLGAALTAPVAGLMLRDRRLGLAAVIAVAYLLPFAVLPVPIGGVKLTFLDAALTILLAVVVFRALVHPEERIVTTPLDLLILSFLGLALTAFALGIDSTSAETFRFFLKTVNSILFFFSVTNTVRTKGELRWIALAVVAGGTGAAMLGLILYFLPSPVAAQLIGSLRILGYPAQDAIRYIAGTDQVRATGTSVDPNVLGGMLILAIPLAVTQAIAPKPLLRRRLFFATTAVMVAGLALTFSRGSFAGFLASLVFIATVRYRRLWAILPLLALLVVVAPQGDLFLDRISSGLTFQDRAAAMRLGEYKDALRLISAYPILGVGFGAAPTIDLYVSVASIYLLIAESMGLVGLAVFLTIGVVLFVYALTSRHSMVDPDLDAIQIGALGGVFAALTAGVFDHYFFNLHFPHTVALFWLLVALAILATRAGLMQGAARQKPAPAEISASGILSA